MSQRYFLSVKSDVERLSEIADFIEDSARSCGVGNKEIYDVQMAVDEACTNIIQHAYHGRSDETIDLTCQCNGKEFVVVIRDFGDRFDPNKVPKPKTRDPLARRSIGGLGMFFMRKLMDRVDFSFSSGGNELTMVKKIKK